MSNVIELSAASRDLHFRKSTNCISIIDWMSAIERPEAFEPNIS